ncbi:MAG: hypothetical protein SVY53_15655 [Chloroflexota bacterium]|nr:hypothetical protein [Chloroflexota bacterium]
MVADMIIRGLNTIVPNRDSVQSSGDKHRDRIDYRVREAILTYLMTE